MEKDESRIKSQMEGQGGTEVPQKPGKGPVIYFVIYTHVIEVQLNKKISLVNSAP